MPWMDLKGAVIMMIVAFIALKVAGGPIANAMEAVTDNFDLGWGKPKIGSFSAAPAEGGNLEFAATLGGDKNNAILEIYRSYIDKADGNGNFKAPDAPNVNDKEKLVYTSEGKGGGKLDKKFKKTCPDECGGTVSQAIGGVSVLSGKFNPGWYTFVAVIKKDSVTMDVKKFTFGFYDNNYLELFDKPVSGCSGCNVAECKRTKLIAKLGSSIPKECREGVMLIYLDFISQGKKVDRTCDGGQCCDYPSPSQMKQNPDLSFLGPITFNGCTAAQIDDVYQKAVALDFYRRACEGAKVDALTEFINVVEKLGKIGKNVEGVKDDVKKEFAGCSNMLESQLKKLGWQQIGGGNRNEKYSSAIASYLDRQQPNLDSATADSTPDGVMTVRWDVPVGRNNVKGFEITHIVTKAIDPRTGKVQTFSEALKKGPEIRSFTHALASKDMAGWHDFKITATSKADSIYRSNEVTATKGLYSEKFIDYYQTPPATKDDATNAHWCMNAGCDVIGKKKAVLLSAGFTDEKRIEVENLVKQLGCVYNDPKGKDPKGMNDCQVPAAVDEAYKRLLERYHPYNSVKYNDALGSECDRSGNFKTGGRLGIEGPISEVCKARRTLKKELDTKGWQEVTVDTPIVITASDVKVQDFRLGPNADGTITASWVLSGPVENIGSFEIKHEHRRYAQNKEDLFVNVLPVYPTETDNNKKISDEIKSGNKFYSVKIGPFDSAYDGSHRFTLKALDSIKYELASSTAPITVNLYDERYIELYDGDAEKCGENSVFKMQDGCNVIGKKREFIKKNDVAKGIYNDDPEIKALFDCDFNRLYKDGKGCRPEAVHALYEAAIKKQYPSEKQKDFLTVEGCKTDKSADSKDICKAKKNLANTLKNRGWTKITSRAADIQPIMPETSYAAGIIPESPLPGELFKLVIDVKSTQPLKWLRIRKAGQNEWSMLPCDWLGNTCRREWNNLYFEPSPKPIKISVVDVTGREVELQPFTPAYTEDCRQSHNVGDKWAGCLSHEEEVVFECGSDGKAMPITASNEKDKKVQSFLCGGIIDYGVSETPAYLMGPCRTCMYDVDCRAVGGSLLPYACPSEKIGYEGTIPPTKVCCQPRSAQEANLKTVAVLSIITGLMNDNIEANRVSGFSVWTILEMTSIINPIKLAVEGSKIQERNDNLHIMEKLKADAEQGMPLASVIGQMNSLREDKKAKEQYLNEKWKGISNQIMSYGAKLQKDMNDEDANVRRKAREELGQIGQGGASSGLSVLANVIGNFLKVQKPLDEKAIAQSNTKLLRAIANYDSLSAKDADEQYQVLDDIYYHVAEIVEKNDKGMAIEMYNVVVQYFPESDHIAEAGSKIAEFGSLKNQLLVLSQGMAIEIFGDPTFYIFGGPKALMSVGKASAAGFVAKSRQMVKLAEKGASSTKELTEELITRAAAESWISKESAAALGKELASAGGKAALQGGRLTVGAVKVLGKVAGRPFQVFYRVSKARNLRVGFGYFEASEVVTGKVFRVRFLKSFEDDLARGGLDYANNALNKIKESYTALVSENILLFAKQGNHELALKLLQGGLSKDEVFKALKNADKLSDDALKKVIGSWLGPEHGITNPKLAKQVLVAKVSPEALEDAAKLKQAATEFILTTEKNERPYLMALTKGGKEVTYQFRSNLGSIDEVGPRLAEKYQIVMDSFPELLDDEKSIRNVLKLVQREEFTADDIGKLLAKGGKEASGGLRKKFIDAYLKKAYGITEDEDAVRVLGSGIDTVVARQVKAELLTKRSFAELLKQRRVLQKRFGEIIRDTGSSADAAAVESELQGLADDIAAAKKLITPGEKIYDKGGKLVAVLGRETGSVSLVPEHFPSFFNQLVVLKVRAADAAYSVLKPLAEGAGTVVSAAHTFAVDYAVPVAKIVKNKALELEPQVRAMLPLIGVTGLDISKATLQTAEDFMASTEIMVAVPVVAVNEDGREELAFIRFANGYDHDLGDPLLDPEQFSSADGRVAWCAFYDVLVEATIDDYVSRSCIPIVVAGNIEKAALGSLNSLNIEGFSTGRQEWLDKVISPFTANIEVTGILTEDEEDALFAKKADEFLGKAGLAYSAARAFREKGLTDLEVQKLIMEADDLDDFNKLERLSLEDVKKLAAAS